MNSCNDCRWLKITSSEYAEEEGAYMWYGRKKVGITNEYTPLKAAFNMLKWCKENNYI